MKLYPECGPCMLNRALLFCRDSDDETRYEVVREVCRLFSRNFSDKRSTTEAAHERNRAIMGITGAGDPLKDLKDASMKEAEKVYPKLEKYVKGIKDDRKRFYACLRIALAGNIMEFGAQSHKLDLNKLEQETFRIIRQKPAIDDSEKIFEKAKASKVILYVTDNAGELVYDRILIKELKKYAKVYVAPLTKPVQDDASLAEIKKAGIDKICPIVPRSDCIGVWFEKCTKDFLQKWGEADLIIAKGMGCYETLSEYPKKTKKKVGLLMKAKCRPVALDVRVPLGSSVIKLI